MNFIYSENPENPIINIKDLKSIQKDKIFSGSINFLYDNGQELTWNFNTEEKRNKTFFKLINKLKAEYIYIGNL